MQLKAHDVSAGYGGRDVLHGADVTVGSGEFVGLIGPNGSGKSTLLRVLSGVLPARAGSVTLDGRSLCAFAPAERARAIGFVPQSETAAFDFSVEDSVLMGRHPHRRRFGGPSEEDYRLVKRALAEADLLHLQDRPITQLSGGEYRRVLLARALAQAAPLLLLDEPTAHLDVTHQVELLGLVRRLTRGVDSQPNPRIGAIAALHDLNQAAEFCDRLVLLDGGRVEAQGAPEQVLDRAHLRRVYNADAQVGRNPVTGRPSIFAIEAARTQAQRPDAPRVHLICGGGSGVGILGALVRAGIYVTVGVLNRFDSDQEAAEALGVETALEAPYSPFSSEAIDRARSLLQQARVVVIAPVPFGRGNLPNLELAAEAQEVGKAVLLIGTDPFAARDFVGGVAEKLFERLMAGGAQRLERIEDWTGRFFVEETQ